MESSRHKICSFGRDKRAWFCLIVYPSLILFAMHLADTVVVNYLVERSPMYYLVTFLVFAFVTIGVLIDIWQRLFCFRVQGKQLSLQEREKEYIKKDG